MSAKKYPTSIGKLRVRQLSAKRLLDYLVDAAARETEQLVLYGEEDPELSLRASILRQEARRRLGIYDVMRQIAPDLIK